tara:strand:- start:287 stop:883 length:597 start_codon:yes stop_codon:yes gene_type:complete
MSAQAAFISPANPIDGLNLNWSHNESNSLQTFNEVQNTRIKGNTIQVDYLVGHNLSLGQQFTGVNHSNSRIYLQDGVYSSHLLHFDPINIHGGKIQNQRFEFIDNIVAIILGGEYLNLSDDLLGNTTVQYENSISRRLEANDLLSLESSNTLLIDKLSVGPYWVDDVRVITQSVPEPSAWALFCLGLLGLVGARKISK